MHDGTPVARYPFPGLRPFHPGEEHLFFGRESQVDNMVDRLSRTRFLAVVGTSGCGKSSLVNCGLRPALHRGLMARAGTSWRIALFRPGSSPIDAMARTLAADGVLFSDFHPEGITLEDMIAANLRMTRLGLADVCEQARLPEGTNLLIIVDQFEELFRYRSLSLAPRANGGAAGEAAPFVSLLLEAASQRALPIYIVITMRSDFLGDCAEFSGLPEAINRSEYLVPRLTREERRAAIAGPIAVGGAAISPVLLTRLVNDVGDDPDQLSILQHALNRTWAAWQHQGDPQAQLDLAHYQAIGTMAHALDRHAEKAYGELRTGRERTICEKIFKALTDKGTDPRGIRRPATLAKLAEVAEAGLGETVAVIDVFRKLSRSFLMPPLPEELRPESVIDISHESLMRVWDRLNDWSRDEAQSAQFYRRLSETAVLHAAGKADLWHDPDLQIALDWRDRERPAEPWAELYGGGFARAMDFIDASKAQRDEEARKKEESRQHELQQARDLAAANERTVKQQREYARRLRRWNAALALVAALLVVAVIFAVRATLLARNRSRDLEKATNAALLAQRIAEHANQQWRLDALRIRALNLDSQRTLAYLSEQLIQYSSPLEAVSWQITRGKALLQMGDYRNAEKMLSQALDMAPGNDEARTSRGYLYLLQGDPKNALADFEYIRDRLDDQSCLNYVNLAITYAQLGNYPAAVAAVEKAKTNVRYGGFAGGREDYVLPDIWIAAGRTTLSLEADGFEAALYYLRADLEAYTGNADAFRTALSEADAKAKGLPANTLQDVYFTGMSWAWLHQRFVCPALDGPCKDYGALISQAQLWERAGYREWAACYYGRFQEYDKRHADPRYAALRQLVAEARAKLPAAGACPAGPAPDSDTLEVDASEALARKDFARARQFLDRALQSVGDSQKTRLLVKKASVLFDAAVGERELGNYETEKSEAAARKIETLESEIESQRKRPQGSKAGSSGPGVRIQALNTDIREARREQARAGAAAEGHRRASLATLEDLIRNCDEILKREPNRAPVAYFYRGIARTWIDVSRPSLDRAAVDFDRALSLEPGFQDALRGLDEVLPESDARPAAAYLSRYGDHLRRYYGTAPSTAIAFLHQARLANFDKRYADAMTHIEKAITLAPERLSLYRVRADAERGFGVAESQVLRNLAEGYRRAGEILKERGRPAAADDAFKDSWATLAKLAADDENLDVQCNAAFTACKVATIIPGQGGWVYSGILEIDGNGGAVRQAVIDKGRLDGLVVGESGNIYSLDSDEPDGHRRPVAKLGTGVILSTDEDTAVVRITMDSPAGDGMVREGDCIELFTRTQPHPKNSRLWKLVTYNVVVEDTNGDTIVDYRSLYSDHTEEQEDRLRRLMLGDVHEFGRRFGDAMGAELLKGKPLEAGKYRGKTLRAALENATLADLDESLDAALKTPGDWFGRPCKPGFLFTVWALAGEQRR